MQSFGHMISARLSIPCSVAAQGQVDPELYRHHSHHVLPWCIYQYHSERRSHRAFRLPLKNKLAQQLGKILFSLDLYIPRYTTSFAITYSTGFTRACGIFMLDHSQLMCCVLLGPVAMWALSIWWLVVAR